jgi:hypothetical protein
MTRLFLPQGSHLVLGCKEEVGEEMDYMVSVRV